MQRSIVRVFALVFLSAGLVLATGPIPAAAVDPSLVGQWGPVINWPAVGVHAMLLNNGKVMTWGDRTSPVVYDPVSGSIVEVPNLYVNPVCSGANALPDGRMISLGGGGLDTAGTTAVTGYTPNPSFWVSLTPTNYATWYASTTVLGDGRLLRMAGVGGCNNCAPENPEIYNPATNSWQVLSSGTATLPMYPFTFVRPDSTVAITGASELPAELRIFNPATKTWSTSDPVQVDGASAAMYDVGKVIKAGAATDAGGVGPAARTAYVTDLTAASPRWAATGSMQFPRSFVNLTALPDGTGLATGGDTTKAGSNPATAVLAAENWNPSTGAWTTWASEATARLYHSTAILLPDGRVFVSGSGDDPPAVPDNKTSEIFSPPYLFKGARPTITSAPSQIGYGANFTVATPDAASIASVSLIRTGNTTHFFDQSARRVPVSFTRGAGSLTVTAPANGNVAPPGYYMLFIVNSNGVPSVAPFVQVGTTAQPPPPPPLPMLGMSSVVSDLDTNPPGMAQAFQYTANASGTVNKLSAYLDASNAASTVYVGLYSDNNGNPGVRLAQGSVTNPTASGWFTVNVPAVSVSAGTKYWLALLGPAGGGIIAFRDSALGGMPSQTSAEFTLSQLPATWSPGTVYANSPASIYGSTV